MSVLEAIHDSFRPTTYGEFARDRIAWLADGLIRYREQIVKEQEAAPAALNDLLVGRNFGKVVAKVG